MLEVKIRLNCEIKSPKEPHEEPTDDEDIELPICIVIK